MKFEDNKVIMLSLSNSASGTNLTEATHIIFVEPINSKNEEVKAVESQAIGRPIISCSSGAIGDYVQTTNSGINVNEGDFDGFLKAILKLESNEGAVATKKIIVD
mgnify:CR=1 FL=1